MNIPSSTTNENENDNDNDNDSVHGNSRKRLLSTSASVVNKRRRKEFPSPTKAHRLQSIKELERRRENLRKQMSTANTVSNYEVSYFIM